jgi:hypothetical protein
MVHRSDRLKSLYRGTTTHGRLLWSVGYFPVIHRDIDSGPSAETGVKSSDIHRRISRLREMVCAFSPGMYKHALIDVQISADVPPSEDLKAGLLAFQIHQMADVQVPSVRGRFGHRTYVGMNEAHMPSTYCLVYFNGERVFKTRTKKVFLFSVKFSPPSNWLLTD